MILTRLLTGRELLNKSEGFRNVGTWERGRIEDGEIIPRFWRKQGTLVAIRNAKPRVSERHKISLRRNVLSVNFPKGMCGTGTR
jgi:hypothetical protein